jgi:hypothetical protein
VLLLLTAQTHDNCLVGDLQSQSISLSTVVYKLDLTETIGQDSMPISLI